MIFFVFDTFIQSLDNILQMCISATSYAGQKTLAQLGFKKTIDGVDVYPESRFVNNPNIPHYQEFLDAHWALGYS